MAQMMTVMIASLAAAGVGAGGLAAGAAAAGTAAAVGGGAVATGILGTGITLAGLSTAATVVGGLASIYGGVQERNALERQAAQEEVKATQDEIQGKQDALTALRGLNRDQAAIAVAGFSSGIGSEGSVQSAQEAARDIGEQNVELSRSGARFQSAARRSQAGQLRSEGRGALVSGIGRGISAGFSLFQRREARG